MDNFARVRRGSVCLIMIFISLAFFAAVLLPGYRMSIYGFLVGSAASLLNTLHLAWKVDRLGAAAAEGSGRRAGLGFVTRASAALLAGVISSRYGFGMAATVAGLLLAQLAAFLPGVFLLHKSGK